MYEIDDREVEAIRRVIQSRIFFRYEGGRLGTCDQFERDFARKLGGAHALTVTTGTNALIAALGACGIGPGDEVLVPAYTFVATVFAVVSVGAVPIIVNVDPHLGLCPKDMKKKITPRTRAVIPVQIDGLSSDMGAIVKIARAHKLHIIEDVCQAVGGTYKGKYLGTFGDFGCFSFNQDKILSCGEGGAIVTGNPLLYERSVLMQDSASLFTTRRWENSPIEKFMGGAMRVSEIQGAMLQVQLSRLDSILQRLRERKEAWRAGLAGAKAWTLLEGHDRDGDCGTSVHLHFESEAACKSAAFTFREVDIRATPMLQRPGHKVWEWIEYLEKGKMAHHPGLDPLRMSATKTKAKSKQTRYPYGIEDYRPSLDVLRNTLKVSVDIRLTVPETLERAKALRKRLEGALATASWVSPHLRPSKGPAELRL